MSVTDSLNLRRIKMFLHIQTYLLGFIAWCCLATVFKISPLITLLEKSMAQ